MISTSSVDSWRLVNRFGFQNTDFSDWPNDRSTEQTSSNFSKQLTIKVDFYNSNNSNWNPIDNRNWSNRLHFLRPHQFQLPKDALVFFDCSMILFLFLLFCSWKPPKINFYDHHVKYLLVGQTHSISDSIIKSNNLNHPKMLINLKGQTSNLRCARFISIISFPSFGQKD